MTGPARLAGLVLVGGSSTRFGRDKALEVVDGRSLLEHAVACLRTVCDGRVLVASGDGRSRPGVADGEVADVRGARGPLAGIAAGLAALRTEAPAVAVLAVDHPAPSAALLRSLARRRGDAACALAVVDGWRQPLHAVWATAIAPTVVGAVADGVAGPLPFLDGRTDVVEVDAAELGAEAIDAAAATRDVDTPGDLPA